MFCVQSQRVFPTTPKRLAVEGIGAGFEEVSRPTMNNASNATVINNCNKLLQ